MSSENLGESNIYKSYHDGDILIHIDDESQEEYIGKLAPKAQEESLIIDQDSDSNSSNELYIEEPHLSEKHNVESFRKNEIIDNNYNTSKQEDESDLKSEINFEEVDITKEIYDGYLLLSETKQQNNSLQIVESIKDDELHHKKEVENNNNNLIDNEEEQKQMNKQEDNIKYVTGVDESNVNEDFDRCESSKDKKEVQEIKQFKDSKDINTSHNMEDSVNFDCEICNKTVYPFEKVSANNHIFHKQCFRCNKCKCALLVGNFSFNNDKPYCRSHYMELFKKRGRYDELDNNEADQQISINDSLTDELPAPDITKNLLAKFRDLEASSGTSTISTTNADFIDELPAPNTTKKLMEKFSALGKDDSKTVEQKRKPMIELPRSDGNDQNSVTCENQPIPLPKDVIRANEPDHDDMPEQGITKNLVNRFRDLENTGSLNK